MPPSRAEVRAYIEKTREHQPLSDVEQRLQRSAAASSEKLTGQPEWDTYLGKLQAVYNEALEEAENWKLICVNQSSADKMRDAQIEYHSHKGRADAIKWAMELPSLILREYRESRSA